MGEETQHEPASISHESELSLLPDWVKAVTLQRDSKQPFLKAQFTFCFFVPPSSSASINAFAQASHLGTWNRF